MRTIIYSNQNKNINFINKNLNIIRFHFLIISYVKLYHTLTVVFHPT